LSERPCRGTPFLASVTGYADKKYAMMPTSLDELFALGDVDACPIIPPPAT